MFRTDHLTSQYQQGDLLLESVSAAYRAGRNSHLLASCSIDPLTMKKKPASVCTIGYEQSTPAEFADRLAEAGIDIVIDAQAVPLSRKPGFSKNQPAASLAAIDVECKHFVRPGAPKTIRDALRDGGMWPGYERGYNVHLARQEDDL